MANQSRNVLAFVAAVLGLLIGFGCAQAAPIDTPEVFERIKDRVVQIRMLEAASGSKASIGSGFVVSGNGDIVTNFHVIAELVHKPDEYRAEVVWLDGSATPLTLIHFDAVHDLAVVRTVARDVGVLTLETRAPRKGQRIYSVGTPHDLGFTIVEGTYNGLIEQSLYQKIHYTGSINPGMSGGPALTADGRVVGVNVASAGNQVSFLVPALFVQRMLRDIDAQRGAEAPAPLDRLRTQLLANQQRYMQALLTRDIPTGQLGEYQVPGKLGDYLKCWGDAERHEDNLFETINQQCATEDDLYLSRSHTTGVLSYQHNYLRSDRLGRARFFSLYQNLFDDGYDQVRAGKEDVTKYQCQTGFVDNAGLTMKTVLCLRAYRRLPGLYDIVLRTATLNGDNHGVQSTLVVAGVSHDNGMRLAQRYLEAFAWKP